MNHARDEIHVRHNAEVHEEEVVVLVILTEIIGGEDDDLYKEKR